MVSDVGIIAVAVAFAGTHAMPRHALTAYVAERILHGNWVDRAGSRGTVSGGGSSGDPLRDDAQEPAPAPARDGEAEPSPQPNDRGGRPTYRPGTWTENSRASFAPTRLEKPRGVPTNDADFVCACRIVPRRSRGGEGASGPGPQAPLHSRLALRIVRANQVYRFVARAS